jgi:hypothetical protein
MAALTGTTSQLKRTVINLINKYGGVGTLRKRSEDSYDPVAGTVVNGVITEFALKLALFDYPALSSGDSFKSNTNILQGDKQALVIPITGCKPTEISLLKDSVVVDNIEWKIVSIKDLNPSSVDSYVLELQLRK